MTMKAIEPSRENIVTQIVSTSDIKLTEEQKDAIVDAWNWSNSRKDVMKAAIANGVPKDVAEKAYRELDDLSNWANGAGDWHTFGPMGIFPILGIVLFIGGCLWLLWTALVWCGFIGHVAEGIGTNMPLFCTQTACYWLR
jgi:hypothetical protein